MTKRILIADDEPLYLRTTGQLLRKAGYESRFAGRSQYRAVPTRFILSAGRHPY